MNDFGIILIKFGNEFWLILFREHISPKLFAMRGGSAEETSLLQSIKDDVEDHLVVEHG
jgi:hypothetical protein